MTYANLPRSWRWLIIALGVTLSTAFLWIKSASLIDHSYSPDSYAMALLARQIGRGHGFVTDGIRDNNAPAQWPSPSRSFPPLYPVLLALTDAVTGAGLMSGIYLNFAALAASMFCVVLLIARSWFGLALALTCVPCFFVAMGDFVTEATAARTMPVALALLCGLITLMFRAAPGRWRSAGVGVIASLLTLTRFDHLPFAAAVLTAFVARELYLAPAHERRRVLIAPAAFALGMLPWFVHNWTTWHALFASDSSVMTRTTNLDATVMDYFAPPELGPAHEAITAVWLRQRLEFLTNNLVTVWSLRRFLIGAIIAAAVGCALLMRRPRWLGWFAGVAFYGLPLILTISLTKYPDARYFTLIWFVALLTAAAILARVEAKAGRSERWGLWTVGVALVLAVISSRLTVRDVWMTDSSANAQFFDAVHRALAAHGVAPGEPIGIGDVYGAISPEMYAYYTGARAVFLPPNHTFPSPGFESWRAKWNVRWLIVSNRFLEEHRDHLEGRPSFSLGASTYSAVRLAKD